MQKKYLLSVICILLFIPAPASAEMDFDSRFHPETSVDKVRFDTPKQVEQGQVAVLKLFGMQKNTEVLAWFDGRPITIIPGNLVDYGLIAADTLREPEKEELTVSWTGDGLDTRRFMIDIVPRDYGSRSITVDPSIYRLAPDKKKKAEEDAKKIEAAMNRKTPERFWNGPFLRPAAGPTTSPFGRRTKVNGKWRNAPHNGVDFRGGVGAPVRAPADGVVALTLRYYYTGNSIYIDHGQGLISVYYHLSRILVSEGDHVSKGRLIGKIGSTGLSTGPHLHYGLNLDGAWVDPLAFHDLVKSLGLK